MFKSLYRLRTFAFPYKGALLLGIAAFLLARIFEALIPMFLKQGIDTMAAGSADVLIPVLGIIGAVLARFAIVTVARLTVRKVGLQVAFDLRQRLYTQLQHQGAQFFSRYTIGDMMTLDRLPGVAEVAMQQGVYAARTIKRRVEGKSQLGPFRYRDLGSMAMIGKGHAVVSFKGIRLSGHLGFLTWMMVHLFFLTGFRNRVRAFFSWTNSFIRKGRAERTITTHAVSGVAFYTDEESVKTGAVLGDQRKGATSDNGS